MADKQAGTGPHYPQAVPGRQLVCGADSGWRQWQDGGPGPVLIPYPGSVHDLDPQDMGVYGDIRVYSIRWPR